ncbi:Uncharacterised protein [Klebsiella michiganensis]|uniref:Uncharacterized protein n=1 Tax=Klebsiella michiganensis TaxID=1134687 RepID=A0A7H4M2B8_9ENTR|nr:Uncharacterised protein [Klebsiella michiganensis]
MLQAIHSFVALPQPEYLGYTSAISRIRGGKIVDKFTAHVKLILVRRSAQTSLINGNAAPMVVEMLIFLMYTPLA